MFAAHILADDLSQFGLRRPYHGFMGISAIFFDSGWYWVLFAGHMKRNTLLGLVLITALAATGCAWKSSRRIFVPHDAEPGLAVPCVVVLLAVDDVEIPVGIDIEEQIQIELDSFWTPDVEYVPVGLKRGIAEALRSVCVKGLGSPFASAARTPSARSDEESIMWRVHGPDL